MLSPVRLFATPWTAARQAPLSLGFSRQEYWSGLLCPPPGDLPNPGIEPSQMDSSLSEPPGKSKNTGVGSLSLLQGNLPDPGIELGSPALQADSLPAELPGKPQKMVMVGGNSGVHNPLASKPQKHHLLSTADSGFDLFTGVGSGMRKGREEAQEGSGHRIPGSAPELLFPATRAGLTRCYGSGSRAGVLGVRRQNLGERADLTLYHPRCLSLNSPLKPLLCSCDLLRQCYHLLLAQDSCLQPPPSTQQAVPPPQPWPQDSRAQHFHEDEGFPDVGGLFLPGTAVIFFLSTHRLQS